MKLLDEMFVVTLTIKSLSIIMYDLAFELGEASNVKIDGKFN